MKLLCAVFLTVGLQSLTGEEPACVWEATKDGSEIWLVGSMHVMSREDYPLPSVIRQVYDRCERIVMEIDPATMDTPATTRALLNQSRLPQGRVMWRMLDDENREALTTYFELSGRNVYDYREDRPWYVAVRLVTEEYARFGGVESAGLEVAIKQWADKDHKTIVGLECMSDQYRVFSALPWNTEMQLLKFTLRDIGDVEDIFTQLRRAWRKGDLEALRRVLLSGQSDFPELFSALYRERNDRWLPRIQEMGTARTPVMFVVGVGHLLGDTGLPALLSQNGWTVERVVHPVLPRAW